MKNWKISQQIIGGFAIVIAIFSLVAVTAFSGLTNAQNGFKDYRELARDTNLNSRLLANMLLVRMTMKEFLISNNAEDHNDYFLKLEEYLETASTEIQNPDRAILIKEITNMLIEYRAAFISVSEIINQRNHLIKTTLDPNGTKMREAITNIILSAYEDKDPDASFRASIVQEELLLGRLYYNKYIHTNHAPDYDFAINQLSEKIGKHIVDLDNALQNPVRRGYLEDFREAHSEYLKVATTIHDLILRRNQLVFNKLDVIGPEVAEALEEVKLSVMSEQNTLGPQLQDSNSTTTNLVLVFSLVAIALGIVFALVVTRGIVQPINRAVVAAEALADGNLAVSLTADSTNETGVLLLSLQKTILSLKSIVGNMSTASLSLNKESEHLSLVTVDTRSGADKQVQMINEISSAMSEMAHTVQEVFQNALDTSNFAASASKNSKEALLIVDRNIEAISLLESEITQTSTSLTNLADQADDIGSILDVIKGIADQTNLLALNAAIEAARAGEQGRGEVRGLAKRTQGATQEIQTLIESLQIGTKDAVVTMTKSKNFVDLSVEEANKSGQALNSISEAIEKINDMSSLIATTAEQQSTTASQINQNVINVEKIAQESRKNVDETVTSSELLSNISSELELVVRQFKI